ncbi:thioredoxin domain-containing protein [Dyadobacter sp. CY312]|uniref:thioredoxin domain-containing protein n=1 Tax=Dyadobacter sp. CY312 TaxID=2907303 RepID=UPI001F358204|nr:thioredoxin domain-containing protein [Dyadobacter sp. CY312]MCE7043692.1 thioredoxin domain-containing protein [Dyadobacter sp. CY312]
MKIKFLLILAMVCTGLAAQAQTKLSPDEFENKLNATKQGQLLDVRTPGEYKDGHLQNAKNIDYKSPAFKEQISKLDKSKPVFVYCLGGVRSAAAADILHESGFTEIYDMTGGYLKWTSAEKPVDGASDLAATSAISMNEFNKLVSENGIVLVDFYAKWCGPCVKMLPVIHKLTDEYKGKAKIQTINYDENKALAKQMGIDEIPAFLLYKNGKLVKRVSGELSEAEFRKLLDGKSAK